VLNTGWPDSPSACFSLEDTEISSVAPVRRSRANESGIPLPSPGTRFVAPLRKPT
jgi:hypothetical protein